MKLNHYFLAWLIACIASKILPHLPNTSPLLALGLFAGAEITLPIALPLLVSANLMGDALLAAIHHYPSIGTWSFYTNSGLIFMALLGLGLKTHRSHFRIAGLSVSGSLLYWLWTNLGTWLHGNLYEPNLLGLQQCFIAALPFLAYSMVGTLASAMLIFNLPHSRLVTYLRG